MEEIFAKISQATGGDVIALIVIFLALSLAVSTAIPMIKVIMGIIGIMAIIYLVDPDIYSTAMCYAQQIVNQIVQK